jgi:HEAT repeat protein
MIRRSTKNLILALILSELGSSYSRHELLRVATDSRFRDDEIRQAAVWGLGKTGLKSYSDLLPFIADADENVAMHAIIGLGEDTPGNVIKGLIALLLSGDPRKAAAASQALRQIGGAAVVSSLVGAASGGNEWIVATLGRLEPVIVRKAIAGTGLAGRVEPLLLLNERVNWLSTEDRVIDLAFLDKQDI